MHYLDDVERAHQTRTAVEAEGRKAIVAQADISDEQQVHRLFDEAVTAFGRVDLLMNSAEVDADDKEVADLDTETWDKAIRTNVYGAFFCCRRYLTFASQAVLPAARSSTSPRCTRQRLRLTGSTYFMDGGLMQNLGQGA